MGACDSLVIKWNHIEQLERGVLRQKFRIRWAVEGDENSHMLERFKMDLIYFSGRIYGLTELLVVTSVSRVHIGPTLDENGLRT